MVRTFFISPLVVFVVVTLLVVIVRLLANPSTRPFAIGLGLLVGLGFLLLVGFVSSHVDRVQKQVAVISSQEQMRMIAQQQEQQARMIAQQQQPRHVQISVPRVPPPGYGDPSSPRPEAPEVDPPPVPLPPERSTASENHRPKMTLIAALRQALFQAWTARGSTPAAEAPEKPAKPIESSVRTSDQRPDWVNSAAKMEGGDYVATVHAGPYTTPIECERELPNAIRPVLTEYADISFGPEASAVTLPDDVLKQLVRQRWIEVRRMELESGTTHDMYTLHALVVVNSGMQQQIRSVAERLTIDERVHGAALVFGGVLGLLALAWGGLKLATNRQPREVRQVPQKQPRRATPLISGFVFMVLVPVAIAVVWLVLRLTAVPQSLIP